MKKILNIFVLASFLVFSFIVPISVSQATSSVLGTTGASPRNITIDADGNVYTANSSSNNVSKITPGGVSTVLGTTGSNPYGITIDPDGNIYTANYGSNNVSKITPGGVSTVLGTTGSNPYGITIDPDGNIYTANSGSNNVSKITPAGVSTILGTTGNYPIQITIDGDGNIYTANLSSNNVSKITPAGVSTILGTTGNEPMDITIDSAGNIYTANNSGGNVTKITPAGVSSHSSIAGYGPRSLLMDTDDSLYVADTAGKITYMPEYGTPYLFEIFNGLNPDGMVLDSSSNIYLSIFEQSNVIKITSDSFFTSTHIISSPEIYFINLNELTITDVPFGTTKTALLDNLKKSNSAQTFDDTDISDPVLTDDTLVVTAEDGETTATYTITVDPELNHDATISSEVYTITIDGNEGTIEGVPSGTSLDDFLANLTMGNENQYWDYGDSEGNVNDPVEDGDTMIVWAEDEETYITYTIYLAADLYWYNSGVDANWNTLAGNWWTDRNHTVQAGALPTWEDSVKTLGTVGPVVDIDDWENPESLDATATGVTFSSAASAPFNSTTFNITGDATFNGTIKYNGTLNGNAVFNDTSQNTSDRTVDGNAIFNDSSVNSGEVVGYACFRDESTNEGDVGGLLCPPIVLTLPATDITQTSVTLNGEITDAIESVNELGFEYGLTTEYGNTAIDEDYLAEETFSAPVSELTCGTTYHFRTYGTNDFDTTYSEDSTFTTSACAGEEDTNNGSSSGSTKRTMKTNAPTTDPTTCLPGQKYNTETGKPCTTYTPSSTNSGPTTCTLTLTLRQGYRGEQVKCLQSKLNLTQDGIFGPLTKNAVILFQQNHNLVPDGVVGPKTRGEMR